MAVIDRAIVTLPLLKGSVRDIRLGLELLLGVTRSVGYVSETLTAAGERATATNLGLRVPLPLLDEADEIFQGRQPCLALVDGRSCLVRTYPVGPAAPSSVELEHRHGHAGVSWDEGKVTLDALHFNPKATRQIHQAGGVYVIQVKDNQPELQGTPDSLGGAS
jgi:hypothetical protein